MKAIVTGHSRGLGAAIAQELLSRRIAVLGVARRGNDALAERFPTLLTQAEADLADVAALARWLDGGALARFLADADATLLVNNAGTVEPVGPPGEQGTAAIARAVTLNAVAPLMLVDAVVAARPEGATLRVAHVSSGAARNPYAGWSVYCATKAALDQHARAATLDRVPGLRICSLAPGVIDTDMQAVLRATPLSRFPMRERFDALKADGALVSPDACAAAFVDHLLGDRFGNEPVADLRSLAG
ncbi:MAG: SDR family oxidoreductase [Burkholderiaceae bacterium]